MIEADFRRVRSRGCLPYIVAFGVGVVIAIAPIMDKQEQSPTGTTPTTIPAREGLSCSRNASSIEPLVLNAQQSKLGIEPSGNTCVYQSRWFYREVIAILKIAESLHNTKDLNKAYDKCKLVGKMLNGLIKKLSANS